MSLENTVGKGEIARNKQFLLFPQCFLTVWINFWHFYQIWNCRLQTLSVWTSLNIVVWERVEDEFNVLSNIHHLQFLSIGIRLELCRMIKVWVVGHFCYRNHLQYKKVRYQEYV